MAISELGWATLTEAKGYFTNERLEVIAWTALTEDDTKNKVLNMAYNRLLYCPDYNAPAKGNETAAQKIQLIKAQCEMAYYLAMHLADEDRRKGLEAQGVMDAGIVKESYDKDLLNKLPIPPFVDALMEDFKTAVSFGVVDIDRDENEKVSKDVVDL